MGSCNEVWSRKLLVTLQFKHVHFIELSLSIHSKSVVAMVTNVTGPQLVQGQKI